MMVPTVQSPGIAVSTAMSAVFAEDPVVSVLDVDLHFVVFFFNSVNACYTLITVGSYCPRDVSDLSRAGEGTLCGFGSAHACWE